LGGLANRGKRLKKTRRGVSRGRKDTLKRGGQPKRGKGEGIFALAGEKHIRSKKLQKAANSFLLCWYTANQGEKRLEARTQD